MKNKPSLFLFSLAAIFLLGNFAPALACFCPRLPLADAFKKSDAVFSGKLIETKQVRRKIKLSKTATFEVEVSEYKFEIIESFLGLEKAKTVVIINDGTNCDLYFEKDKTYLVWAFNEKDDLTTSACTPTKLLEKSKEELDFLKTVAKPKDSKTE